MLIYLMKANDGYLKWLSCPTFASESMPSLHPVASGWSGACLTWGTSIQRGHLANLTHTANRFLFRRFLYCPKSMNRRVYDILFKYPTIHCIMLCCAWLCCAVLCCAMLCYDMIWYDMIWYDMVPCSAILWYALMWWYDVIRYNVMLM